MYTNRAAGIAYISPFLIGLALFLLFPFLASLALSFTDYRLQDRWSEARFIGASNYIEMFADHTVRKSLWTTLVYVLITVPLKLAFAPGRIFAVCASLKFAVTQSVCGTSAIS